jgi:hypothetical protein
VSVCSDPRYVSEILRRGRYCRPVIRVVRKIHVEGDVDRGHQLDAIVSAESVATQVCTCSVCEGSTVLEDEEMFVAVRTRRGGHDGT